MIMRDTVFCSLPPDAATDAVAESIHAMVDQVRQYVPGYALRADPQFDEPRPDWGGNGRVGILLEVAGSGDYLPPAVGGQPGHHDRGRQ